MSNVEHKCPVCGDTRREIVYIARDRHYKIPGEWNVARCGSCGLVQLTPMPSADDLMKLYPEDFYAFQDMGKKQQGLVGQIKRLLFKTLHVSDPKFDRPGRVLDSGCGTGWSLIAFKDRGWECVGVEPSNAAAAFGRQTYGLDIRGGTVHGECFPDAHFNYIRSNHSLEHDPICGDTISEFRRIIREDGKLLIGVPNIDSWPARWFGEYWWYLGAPVHTYNFTLRHLSVLLKKHGFEIISVRYCGNFGGVLGSMQIYRNRNDASMVSTDGSLINSNILKLLGQVISAILNLFHKGDAIEIVARPSASRQVM